MLTDTQAGFTLTSIPDNSLDGDSPARLSLQVEDQAGDVVASISVKDAAGLKGVYCSLAYDPTLYDPLGAASSGLLGSSAGQASATVTGPTVPLCLMVLNKPGTVYWGEVLPCYEQLPGFSGDGVLATVRFARRAFVPREVSSPPVTDASQTIADWNPQAQVLSWRYYCQGDYNQDGMVTINDLTPIGRLFNTAGPFDPTSAAAVVDGNADGLISINDLTPIGINYLRAVASYEVFGSLNPLDLPAANDAQAGAPLLTVPFSEAIGNPLIDRLWFAVEMPGLDPDLVLWVRPVDAGEAGTTSQPQQPLDCQWQIQNISHFATAQASAQHNSLAIIDDLPAIAYYDQTGSRLVYQRAKDPLGAGWESEVEIASGTNIGYFTSLVDAATFPAVCYYDATGGDLLFSRANDAAGSSWSAPQIIDSAGDVGWDCRMVIVNGNPAISYFDLANQQIKFVRAQDVIGSSWAAPVVVADCGGMPTESGEYASLAVIDGNPAIAFYYIESECLKYVRAGDADGASWDSPATAAGFTGQGRFCSLCEVGGAPAVSYLCETGLFYIRSTDSTGGFWNEPVSIDGREILRRYAEGSEIPLDTSLCVVQGRPAISYYSGPGEGALRYARALNATGGSWPASTAIDDTDDVGMFSCLINVGTSPAISYFDATSNQLKYATCVGADSINQAPVAELGATPAELEPGAETMLDASASYDPDGTIEYYQWDFDGDGTNDDQTSAAEVTHIYDAAGSYTARVTAVDQQGAGGQSFATVTVGDELIHPVALLTASTQTPAANENVDFDARDSFDPDGSVVLYEWDLNGDGDFEQNTGGAGTINYEYTAGAYTVSVRVTDNQGLMHQAEICIVAGLLNQPPVADIIASPLEFNPPAVVRLEAYNSYDPDGTIVQYEWDIDGDGFFEIDTGSVTTLEWNFEKPGNHRPLVRVTDNLGATGTKWVTIAANSPPIAVIDVTPTSGTAPFVVTFDGSHSTDKDGTIEFWGWDLFADGKYEIWGEGVPETWQCQMVWNGPIKVTLKVKDNKNLSGTASVTINVSKGWHIVVVDADGDVGRQNSLAVIGSGPAISYYDSTNCSLKYTRASDTQGYQWGMATTIGAISAATYGSQGCQGTSLAYINGTAPGIALCSIKPYQPPLPQHYRYVLASNLLGTTWQPFQQIMPGVGVDPDLKIVASKPAIASLEIGLSYVRAIDASGTTWGTPVQGIGGSSVCGGFDTSCSLAIINGNPAIAFSQVLTAGGNNQILSYVRATDSTGSKWGSIVTIDNVRDPGQDVSLCEVGGRPAVGYVATAESGLFEVRYKRADNANGTSWKASALSVKEDGRRVAGLVVINGNPAIGLRGCQNHDVCYVRASDSAGANWPAAQYVYTRDKNTGGGSTDCDMAVVHGMPAISFRHSINGDLMYAVLE